jgi:hemerythrin-like domain-containing protein
LRRQHDVAVELVTDIVDRSARIETSEDAYRLSVQLAKLTGLLRIHFVQEDRTLYPYMIASSNPAASETAHAFSAEMGGLSQVFEAFARKWTSSEAILGDAVGFRRESGSVFAALGARIVRENEELYPLADSIQPHEVRRTA